MQKERELNKEDLLKVKDFLVNYGIDKGELLRQKKSKYTGKIVTLYYFKYLDLYFINDMYFSRQIFAVNYFNKL